MTAKTPDKNAVLKTAKDVLLTEGRALYLMARSLNADFVRAVELFSKCRGKVIVFGIGKSGLVGRKIASTLSSTGTPSIFLHPVECFHGDLGMLSNRDAALALSYSGETEELGKLIPLLKNRKLPIVSMTGHTRSKLAMLSDIVIPVHVEREACPYNITPTASTTAMLAVGDALAVALMKLRKFGKNDFAKLHPGGSLGKILTLRVKDLMHTGRHNPVINESRSVREALFEMTRTRFGATSVVNSKGRLTGFFTDGDLRRKLQKQPGVMDAPISLAMTKNPVTISPETMAVDAARILARKGIDNIPVVDIQSKPVGILDERDLLEIIPLVKQDAS